MYLPRFKLFHIGTKTGCNSCKTCHFCAKNGEKLAKNGRFLVFLGLKMAVFGLKWG